MGVSVAAGARRAGLLSRSGAVAAALVGTLTVVGTGWWGGIILLTFFVGSSLVSRWCPDPAAARGEAKGGQRDAGQVLANGGAPALAALLGLSTPTVGFAALAGGLAVAAADTWATSFGGTTRTSPRHLLTWRPVVAGTSGGVTWRGTIGAIGGAASIGIPTALATRDVTFGLATVMIGFAGMWFDSLLGAAAQGRFHCDACGIATERPVHACGMKATPIGGHPWVTNDTVNALATIAGTLAAVAMQYYQT